MKNAVYKDRHNIYPRKTQANLCLEKKKKKIVPSIQIKAAFLFCFFFIKLSVTNILEILCKSSGLTDSNCHELIVKAIKNVLKQSLLFCRQIQNERKPGNDSP